MYSSKCNEVNETHYYPPLHIRGRLLSSLQSATPIETERSDEVVKNSTEICQLFQNVGVFLSKKILITL